MRHLQEADVAVYNALKNEDRRQENCLELIASENFVSQNVLETYSCTLTNKYAEGLPKKRYYHGCENADDIESLAIERVCKIFAAKYANVQAHSGATANQAVFYSFLQPGDTFLGLDLSHGGHLTHGAQVNFSGKTYHCVSYQVRKEDHLIDFDQIERLCREHKPKMIICGFSAYPRIIDFDRFQEIAEKHQAILLCDMAHIAGLVAGKQHPSPIGKARIVTTTTHKTLRGPRGGVVLWNQEEDTRPLNMAVFPGLQGGPLMHVIAAKAVAFGEALQPNFAEYAKNVVVNAKALAESLQTNDISLVSGGTDTHLLLINLLPQNTTGKIIADALDEVGITANKNTIPFDPKSPFVTSGVRLGTAALTTRGLGSAEMAMIGAWIAKIINNPDDAKIKQEVTTSVQEMCQSFPMDRFRLT